MHERQKLSLDEFVDGRRKALENARDLVQDAEILLEKRHYARAVFLAQIAGEEVGKYLLLTSYTYRVVVGKINWKSFWKSFRSHRHKLESTMLTEIILTPATNAEAKRRDLDEMKTTARFLEHGKQLSLYVDYVEGAFRQPAELIQEGMARNAVTWAKGRLAMTRRIEEIYAAKAPEEWTAGEIEELEDALSRTRDGESFDPRCTGC